MPYKKLNHIKDLLKTLDEKKGLCFIVSCGRQSIASHTISESRILEKLQEKDGKHGIVLLHLEDKPNVDFKQKKLSTYKNSERRLIRKGKSKSSIFYGFCDKHDPDLFWNLDNEAYVNNSKINFLHAYRAFALYISKSDDQFTFLQQKVIENLSSINPELSKLKPDLQKISLHLDVIPDDYLIKFNEVEALINKMEDLIRQDIINDKSELRQSINQELSQLTNESLFPITGLLFKTKIKKIIDSSSSKTEIPEKLIIDLEKGLEYRIEENTRLKSKFNALSIDGKYDELNYLSRSINRAYKITGNFVFRTINDDLFSLTLFPEFEIDKTQIIISSIGNDKTFLSQINIMNNIDYQKFISSIIIGQGTNVFISPSFFYNLDTEIQTKMLNKKRKMCEKSLNIFKINDG